MFKNVLISMVFTFSFAAKAGSLVSIFELPFGSPYPPYTDNRDKIGLPIEIQSVLLPVTKKDDINMFYDYRLTYLIDSGKIYSAQARRVYETYEKCLSDKKVLKEKVLERIPDLKENDTTTFKSDKLVADIGCYLNGNEKFFTLSFGLYEKTLHDQISRN